MRGLEIAGLAMVAALVAVPGAARAEGPAPGALTVAPMSATLRGPDAILQLVAETGSGIGARDHTQEAKYVSSDPAVVTVDERGRVTSRGDGSATIAVTLGDQRVEVSVTAQDAAGAAPMNFANQVVPIFTKLGCNGGGCHGKSGGQNGFRLGLLGFDPALDYEALVKESRGRRLFPAAPERSLLLQKATAQVPHGGGKKMEADSREFEVITRWVRQGMPMGRDSDPTVARIEVHPEKRVLTRGAPQQLRVVAHYTDGTTEDVTPWAQYQSNDTEVAQVAEGGLVTTREMAGQAGIMTRYQGHVAVFTAQVPLGLPVTASATFKPVNFIDELAQQQWQALGLVPSDPCTDEEFIRRASLDIAGTLPTADEVKAFRDDADPDKRPKLVDRLLARPEYASFFAIKWADILKNKRENNPELAGSTFRFHAWIREQLAKNVPYDQFARGVLAANGTPRTAPAVAWHRTMRTPDAYVDDTAQVFLGMRLQCAKCHHHPFEVWSQDDYYGFAAFFGRVGRKAAEPGGRRGDVEQAVFNARGGQVNHPKTGKAMTPKGLGGPEIAVGQRDDPRHKLADWLAERDNPYFAQALVNRYWAHFNGRGLVEPIDDMRQTNPPSNPALMKALADDFVSGGYDLKRLVRTICTSSLYGLSSVPNEWNARDKQSFARRYPKRMGAEVLLDAVAQVTGSPTPFGGMPAGTRAIDLPDESVPSGFLDTFGRPKRDTACECERVTDASLGQSLMLLNSPDVQAKLAAGAGRAEVLANDPRPVPEKVEEVFWATFARPPLRQELEMAAAHLEKKKDKPKEAWEDILWALINAKEFQFID